MLVRIAFKLLVIATAISPWIKVRKPNTEILSPPSMHYIRVVDNVNKVMHCTLCAVNELSTCNGDNYQLKRISLLISLLPSPSLYSFHRFLLPHSPSKRLATDRDLILDIVDMHAHCIQNYSCYLNIY